MWSISPDRAVRKERSEWRTTQEAEVVDHSISPCWPPLLTPPTRYAGRQKSPAWPRRLYEAHFRAGTSIHPKRWRPVEGPTLRPGAFLVFLEGRADSFGGQRSTGAPDTDVIWRLLMSRWGSKRRPACFVGGARRGGQHEMPANPTTSASCVALRSLRSQRAARSVLAQLVDCVSLLSHHSTRLRLRGTTLSLSSLALGRFAPGRRLGRCWHSWSTASPS